MSLWLPLLNAGVARAADTLRARMRLPTDGYRPAATWRGDYRDIGAGCKCDSCRPR
jgi:hypothetical protein